ncbi:MAG: cell division protein [Alphaproteobacteria bacterium]|nr:cell division protein [Alphaproteobacteria bacterium]
MFGPRTDLALSRDPAGRTVPWIIAAMVFIGTLSLAAAFGLNEASAAWRHLVTGNLTVQVPDGPDADARADEAARVLAATPGIASARRLERAEVLHLLEPWLGRDAAATQLPLPRLVDVRLDPALAIDTRALALRLAESVPEARLDDHGPWLERLSRLTRGLQMIAAGGVGIVACATMLIVVFTIRAGLLVHREVISVLHLIGAQDAYIARQFQWHAVNMAFKGALPAFLLAALVAFALGLAADRLSAPLIPKVALGTAGWLALPLVPLTAILLAAVTARLTVLLNLKRTL